MKGIVLPDPVPAMTILSRPSKMASATSNCHSYGRYPERVSKIVAIVFLIFGESYFRGDAATQAF
jgi:hypothetical protein